MFNQKSISLTEYIKSDLAVLTGGSTSIKEFLKWYFFPRGEMFPFIVWFRILLVSRRKYGKYLSFIPYFILRHYEFKYGIHPNANIPVGKALHIVHGDGVHLNAKSIGDNVTIYQGVTLGVDKRGGVPIIGDNVTIYTNAVVVGNITIGDGAVIGANSFVNKSVTAKDVIVGCPGRSVRK